ncbi:MAG: choice-of-anchor D domain-containing protein [Acidobacteriota bacterium]
MNPKFLCLLLPLAVPAAAVTRVFSWDNPYPGHTTVPKGLTGVTAIAGGDFHSLALKSDGTVVAWGGYAVAAISVPAGLTSVTAIAAGTYHSLALKSDGTVVAWGYNDYGQTAVPAGLNGVTTIAAGVFHSLALKSDGTVVAWGYNGSGQATVPAGLTGVKAIAAGESHSMAVLNDGTIVTWGGNTLGQRNVPAGLTGVIAVAAAGHSMALKNDGTVVAWGYNCCGQTAVPAGLAGVTAIDAGGWHSLALKNDGTVIAWGNNQYSQGTVPAGLTGVTAISAGTWHNLVLTTAIVEVTVATSPLSLQISVDGGAPQSAPRTFEWFTGSSHTIATSSQQAQYSFSGWSDGLAVSHNVAPTLDATYTASFSGPLIVPSSPVTLPPTDVGNSSASTPITVTNSYGASLEIASLALVGPNASDFKVGSNTCSNATLAPGQSCTFGIAFQPRVAGTRDAEVRIFGIARGTLPAGGFTYTDNINPALIGNIALTANSYGIQSIAATKYQMTDLGAGAPPGATLSSEIYRLNGSGQVAGTLNYPDPQLCMDDATFYESRRAFLYSAGTFTVLNLLPGARAGEFCSPSSQVAAINDAGQVLGWSTDASGNWRPVLWSGGTVRDLNELVTDGSGISLMTGLAINNRGVILAYADGKVYLLEQGVLTEFPNLSQLGLVSFRADVNGYSFPYTLNDSGQFLVGTDQGTAVLDKNNGTLTLVGPGVGINDNTNGNGKYGKYYGTMSESFWGNSNLAIWEKGVLTDLGGFPCAYSPTSMNSSTQVVGGSCDGSGAFFWDNLHGIRDLGSLLAPAANWQFGGVAAPLINDAGQILAHATNPVDNSIHRVLLSPIVATAAGSNVVVQSSQTTLTFPTVTSTGTTTITPIDPATAGSVPGGFAVSGAFAYQIDTTATFSGPVTMAFVVPPPISLDDFNALSVLHNVNGTLVDVTATSPARDYATRTIYATTTSFSPFYLVRRGNRVNVLFDQSKAYKSGSTIPVKVQILSSSGANLSSATVPLTMRGAKLIGGGTLTTVQDSGNSNPDSTFRYDATGTGGYIYNLSTKGMASGKYSLSFYAGAERDYFYTVTFELR